MENTHIEVALELSQNFGVRFVENFRVILQCSEGQIGRGVSDLRPRIHWKRGRFVLEEQRRKRRGDTEAV